MAGTLDIGALETRLQGIEGVLSTIRTWIDSTATPGLEKSEKGITGLLDRIVGGRTDCRQSVGTIRQGDKRRHGTNAEPY